MISKDVYGKAFCENNLIPLRVYFYVNIMIDDFIVVSPGEQKRLQCVSLKNRAVIVGGVKR